MDLDWIEDFLALADSGVFSKAALRRNVTQPAFTRRIRKLEYALGATLFDRSVHPVVLTQAGEEFRPTAAEILRMVTASRARLQSRPGADSVAIASLQSLAISTLPGLLAELGRARAMPAVKVMADDYAGCLDALQTGAADMMLTYAHPGIEPAERGAGYRSIPVAADRMIAVSAMGPDAAPLHTLEEGEVPWLAYTGESFLGKLTALILGGAEVAGRLVPRYQTSMADGLKSAARAGLGVAWLPARIVAEDLAQGRLARISAPAEEVAMDITLVRTGDERSRAVERLWAALGRRTAAPPPA
jgi:DNA-binding transcriptional LysR family regulator